MLRLALVIGGMLAVGASGRPGEVSFDRDVRPILSEYCFRCHGPDANARKAELRLDTREGMFAARENGAAVVAGRPELSEVIRRVTADDPAERMPPESTHERLSAAQVDVLRAWIRQGARWETHWAFEKPVRPELPDVGRSTWPINPIDRFVLARLTAEGLLPSPRADRRRLLRRVTLDLTGLPPTPDELAAFVADRSANAYEQVVDRLLASPRYGERMAWDWLDAARYADTNGYQGDRTRTMWPYRDWVVDALNRNLPYDRFLTWQLAGDLLPEPTFEQRLATAFCRNHMINGEGGRIAEENRVEYAFDQVETLGTVWLGLTLTCCRCHDHKFDPITQRNYYELFAYFDRTPVTGAGGDPQTPPVLAVPSAGDDVRVMVMADREGEPRETRVLYKGLYNQPRERVTAGVPQVLPPLPAGAAENRLSLARWLVDPDHPLTARVVVNRHWQKFFGTGLVKTVEDFGARGEKPSHPELLAWLASEFIESGWDVKALHRLIVTSAAYRQTARSTPERIALDPENRLLARGPRHRMPSWMIRDLALAVGGLLVEKLGGPPVKPYQPAGIWAEATFGNVRYEADTGEKLYRRSLYTFWRRIVGPTMFFDTAKRQTCSVSVTRTNTPLHALVTLNDTTYVEAARAFAQRVLLGPDADAETRLATAFELATSRRPTRAEVEILLDRLACLRRDYADRPGEAEELLAVGASPRDDALDAVEHAAWTGVCSLILNLDETLNN